MSVTLFSKSVYSQQACFDMRYLYQCLDIRNILYECVSAMLPPIILEMPRIQTMECWRYSMHKISLIPIHIRIWFVFVNFVCIVREEPLQNVTPQNVTPQNVTPQKVTSNKMSPHKTSPGTKRHMAQNVTSNKTSPHSSCKYNEKQYVTRHNSSRYNEKPASTQLINLSFHFSWI
jgi:hypothetical protein